MDTLKTEDTQMWSYCCRICVGLCDSRYCIHDRIDQERPFSVHSMLEKLFPAIFNQEQVDQDHFMNWPSTICSDCRLKVINAFVLYEQCANSVHLLNQLQFVAIVDATVGTPADESCVPDKPLDEELQLAVSNTRAVEVKSPAESIIVDNVPQHPETPAQPANQTSIKKFQIRVPIVKKSKRKKATCKSGAEQLTAKSKRKMRSKCDGDGNSDATRPLATNKKTPLQSDGDGNRNTSRVCVANNKKRLQRRNDGNSNTAQLRQCDNGNLPDAMSKENFHSPLAANENSQSLSATVKAKNQAEDKHMANSKDATKVWQPDVDELETKIDLYQCVLCDAPTYSSPKEFTDHLQENHPDHIRACEQCPKVFVTQTAFEQHLYCHATGRSFFCTFCDKGFQTEQLLKNHVRTHTHRSNYLCSHCGKEFNNNSNLRQHIIVHSGHKPWACNLCPCRFSTKGGLTIHQNTHTKVKAFSCDTCGSQFNKHYSLIKHKLIHTGERPFGCEVCGMRFATSYMVKRHMRTHTGEKPFKCTYCDRSFAQSNDMVKHMKRHVGSNPYQCDRCNATFRLLTDLRNHYKEHYQTGEVGAGSATDQDKSIRFTSSDILQLRFQKEKKDMNGKSSGIDENG